MRIKNDWWLWIMILAGVGVLVSQNVNYSLFSVQSTPDGKSFVYESYKVEVVEGGYGEEDVFEFVAPLISGEFSFSAGAPAFSCFDDYPAEIKESVKTLVQNKGDVAPHYEVETNVYTSLIHYPGTPSDCWTIPVVVNGQKKNMKLGDEIVFSDYFKIVFDDLTVTYDGAKLLEPDSFRTYWDVIVNIDDGLVLSTEGKNYLILNEESNIPLKVDNNLYDGLAGGISLRSEEKGFFTGTELETFDAVWIDGETLNVPAVNSKLGSTTLSFRPFVSFNDGTVIIVKDSSISDTYEVLSESAFERTSDQVGYVPRGETLSKSHLSTSAFNGTFYGIVIVLLLLIIGFLIIRGRK